VLVAALGAVTDGFGAQGGAVEELTAG